MAGNPLEYTFEVNGEEKVIAALKDIDRRLDNVSQSTKKTAESTSSLSGTFGGLGAKFTSVSIQAQAIGQALGKIVDVAKAVAARIDEINDVSQAFTGNIDELRGRVSGLISDMDLMKASNQAAQRGLLLTSQQMGDVAVKAKQFADATGTDAVQAMNELIVALATGRDMGLKKFGISATDATSALKELSAEVGSLNINIESADDVVGGASSTLDNMANAFLQAASKADGFNIILKAISDGKTDVTDFFDTLTKAARVAGDVVAKSVDDIANRFARLINLLKGKEGLTVGDVAVLGTLINPFTAAGSVGYTAYRNLEPALDAERDRNYPLMSLDAEPEVLESVTPEGTAPYIYGTGGGGRTRGGTSRAQRAAQQAAAFRDMISNLAGNPENRFDTSAAKFREADAISVGVGGSAKGLMASESNAAAKAAETLAKKQQEALRAVKGTADAYREIGGVIGGVVTDAFSAMLDGEKNFGDAVLESFKGMLAGLAKSEAVKAIAAAADGFSKLSNPLTAPLATADFTAAGKHAAAAVLAGAGAAGMTAGGIGGGGGGGGGASGGASVRPPRDNVNNSGDQGSRTVVINWNQPAILAGTYADAGRAIRRALSDADSRYGGR